MTRQRNDDHSTEFGLWLRKQPEIDSRLGFVTTNIDYIWQNYKTGKWMIIEEKRYMADLTYSQKKQMETLARSISDDNCVGFNLLQFENTSPDDGKIYLNYREITKQELVNFLMFNYEDR